MLLEIKTNRSDQFCMVSIDLWERTDDYNVIQSKNTVDSIKNICPVNGSL